MKKIIWLFGAPGSGKKTIMDNIDNNKDARKLLDLEDDKIIYLNLVYDRDAVSADYRELSKRKDTIVNGIKGFLHSEEDVLIVNGEISDFSDKQHDILKKVTEDYPDVEKEIVFLNPSDVDVLFDRMKNTVWYNSKEENKRRYTKDWLSFSVKYMKDSLIKFEELGYKFKEIDTLDGYSIKGKAKTI